MADTNRFTDKPLPRSEALAALGAALVAARAAGVPWKVLQRETGYGRTRLWMLWRESLGTATARPPTAPGHVHERRANGPDPNPIVDE